MTKKYVYPNVLMSAKDTSRIATLQTDIQKEINARKSDWIMNGFSDKDWDKYIKKLDAYGMKEYLELFQKYLNSFYSNKTTKK